MLLHPEFGLPVNPPCPCGWEYSREPHALFSSFWHWSLPQEKFLLNRKAPCGQVSTDPASTRYWDLRGNDPGDVCFYLLIAKGNSGDHPTEKPGDEQVEYLQGRDGISGTISSVLMSTPAAPVQCPQMQPVTFHGKENCQWQTNQASIPTSCGLKPSNLCRLTFGIENIYVGWTNAIYYSKVSTVTLHEFCLCLWARYLFWGRNS